MRVLGAKHSKKSAKNEKRRFRICCRQRPFYNKEVATSIFYDELDTALERHPEVEGVIIATPISTHFGLALRVLESGRHVLIQKPMAMTTEECDILEDVARSKDLQIMVAHTFLFTGAVKTKRNFSRLRRSEAFWFGKN